ncbi:outer membrane beta-barrel protein [Roseateles sp.]|uniref:outer membrane beta-barrel protein n=1 Tax=Roseateles sp. TaxID=1971397 RepID=UPI00326426AE
MKKQAIVLAALIGAASAHAQAQATEPVYITVAGGATKLNLDCSGTTSCDASDTGLKLVGGYQFGNGLSLELGYLSFGKFRATDGALGITVKPTAFVLGGAFAMPLGADWGFNFRLGLAQVKTKVSAVSGSLSAAENESKAKTYVGAGITYAISKTVKLEFGADATEAQFAGEKGTLRMFSLGATFAF